MMTATKNLVVCADDFALNASVSEGIARLAAIGRISAASVMTLSPRWAQDQALLRGLPKPIDVGLHLDWTSDFARQAGHGLSLARAMRRAVVGGFDVNQAQWVVHRQLDLFEAHWGQAPDFVDGHQHVHQFDGIRQALVEVLSQRYPLPSQRPYLRIARVQRSGLKGWVISQMGAARLEHQAKRAALAHSGALAGVYDFAGAPARFAQLMAAWLHQADAGSIVMCHPAARVEAEDPIGVARVQEFNYMGSKDFRQALHDSAVRLVRGQELFASAH